MLNRPSIVVLAGPNGAGKTTAAPFLLRDALAVREYVNADAIAQGLSAFSPDDGLRGAAPGADCVAICWTSAATPG